MVSIRPATLMEVKTIHSLSLAAADGLTRRFGKGAWSDISLLNTLRRVLRGGTLFIIVTGGKVVGTFTVDTVKGDFYLRSMSVQPASQRHGIGRRAMTEIETLARLRCLKAIRSDAYEADAGAGGFYLKCGYKETGHGVSNGVKLAYYEKVLL